MEDPGGPEAARGPIFIVGAMGSGTTLLRLILDSHEHIAVPPETGFMRAYKAHRFIPFKWSGRGWAERLGWSEDELDEQLRILYDTLFRRYAAQHGKQRWGEKTPLHTWHIDDIARLFPDAVFVGIVRHPCGSVGSNVRRWRHSIAKASFHYLRYNKEIVRQAARYRERFVLLRYEELLLQPEPVMRDLLDWLDEPWSDHVLEHHLVQAGRDGTKVVEGRNRVDDPIDVARISKWEETLPSGAREKLAARVGRLGEFFGYAIEDPAVLDPLTDRETLVVTGAELDARIDRFPDLDLRTPMPPPKYELLYHPADFTLEQVRPPDVADPPPPPPPGLVRRSASASLRLLPTGARRRLRATARRLGEELAGRSSGGAAGVAIVALTVTCTSAG